MSDLYFFVSSILEKCEFKKKNCPFSGRIPPDWGNTARADTNGLVSTINFRLTR